MIIHKIKIFAIQHINLILLYLYLFKSIKTTNCFNQLLYYRDFKIFMDILINNDNMIFHGVEYYKSFRANLEVNKELFC